MNSTINHQSLTQLPLVQDRHLSDARSFKKPPTALSSYPLKGKENISKIIRADIGKGQNKQNESPLQIPFELSGVLEIGDNTFEDGGLYDVYIFEGMAGQPVKFNLVSEDFDANLFLFNADIEQIADNDDSNSSTNSELALQLPETNEYHLVVTAYGDDGQGNYELKANAITEQEAKKNQADQLLNQALRLSDISSWQDALQKFERALLLYQEIGDRIGETTTLNGLGLVYRYLGNYLQALDTLNKALTISREINDRSGESSILSNIGVVYEKLGQYPQALEYYEQSLTIGRKLGNDRQNEGITLSNIGLIYHILGQYTQALEHYEQALSISREVDNRYGEGQALNNIGGVYENLDQYTQALEYYEQALAINREINNHSAEGSILNNIGIIYRSLGQYNKALEYYHQALIIRRDLGERPAQGITLNNIGRVHEQLGQYLQALEYYEQTLAIDQSLGEHSGKSTTLHHLGSVYFKLGQYPQALKYYNHSLAINQALGERLDEGIALGNIALVYHNLGQYLKALEYYNQALSIHREINNRSSEGITLNNIGNVYSALNQHWQALGYHHEALSIHRETNNRSSEGITLNSIGNIYRILGQYPQALDTLNKALSIGRELGELGSEGTILDNIGHVYHDLGQYPQALDSLNQALTISRKIGDLAGEGNALNNIGYVLLSTNQLLLAEKHFNQSLSVLESLRDRDLSDESKVALFETQLQTYRGLQQTLIDQDREDSALEISERSRARAFIELLENRLSDKENITLNNKFLSIKEIQSIAQNQQTTLIEYSVIETTVGDSALYIWVISPGGNLTFRQVDLTSINLSDLVASSRNAIGARSRATIAAVPTAAARKQQQADLKQLHQLLIDPIADLLPTDPNQPVVFIPQDELFLVPFPALLDQNDQHLIQKHTILTAPSIQVLDLTQKQQTQLGPLDLATLNPSDALLVGNPTMPKVYNPTSDSLEQLSPLSGAGDEAITIGNALGITPLIGDDATEATVKAQIENARLIHLATHGLLDYGDPKETGVDDIPGAIALAPTSTEDGLLTTAELLDMDLTADLVVLSACDTGRGTITGDGVIGLSRGLITAGVPSVIVSLWKVPDKSTALLMTEFYKNWQTTGNKAQALRQAMLTTMEKYPDPVHWAAFTLIGEDT